MSVDVRGLPITVANDAALAAYERAVAGYLAQKRDTMDQLDSALDDDPEFVMAHCLRAYLLKTAFDPAFLPKARDSLEIAKKAAARATEREQRHVAAAELLLGEKSVEVLATLDGIAIDHPTDLMNLKLTQFLHFWRGDAANMRDVVGRALYAWDPTMPGYGFVLGMLSFGFEEGGEYEAAERVGREAVDLNPEDSWAVHAVAHTIEMEGPAYRRHRLAEEDGARLAREQQTSASTCGGTARFTIWSVTKSMKSSTSMMSESAARKPILRRISPMDRRCSGACICVGSMSMIVGKNSARTRRRTSAMPPIPSSTPTI